MLRKAKIPSWVGDLLLFITAIVWGGGFIGVAESLDTLTPYYMIAMRFTIASVLMGIVFFKKIKQIEKSDLMPGILSGLFLFLGFAAQTQAAVFVSVGKLAFLTALNVIMVPFISLICFKEQIKKYNLVASMIATVGFAFLNLSKETGLTVGLGELLGIGGALGFAMQIAVLGKFAKECDPIKLAILQIFTCAILGIISAVLFEQPPKAVTVNMILPVAYLGIFSSFIGFLFQTMGQKYTSASRAAIIMSMEAVFGIILSIIMLKEKVTISTLIGASLIFAAVIIAEYMHARMNTHIEEQIENKGMPKTQEA